LCENANIKHPILGFGQGSVFCREKCVRRQFIFRGGDPARQKKSQFRSRKKKMRKQSRPEQSSTDSRFKSAILKECWALDSFACYRWKFQKLSQNSDLPTYSSLKTDQHIRAAFPENKNLPLNSGVDSGLMGMNLKIQYDTPGSMSVGEGSEVDSKNGPFDARD
jgi:hypothetical protein